MRGPWVVRRALSEPLLLLAAFGSILLATTTLVSLTMYATSTAEAGLRRAMETAPLGQVAAVISTPVTGRTFPRLDAAVRERVGAAYAGAPVTITTAFRSDSYMLPGQERRKRPGLLRFGSHDALDRHARLVTGSWPRPAPAGESVVEAAVSLSAASAAGWESGQEFTTEGRLGHRRVRVRVTGVFQLDDPFGDRWAGEQLLSRGVETGDFTTYGPLMVPRETFLARFATNVTATWTAVPDLRGLTPEALRPFAARVAGLRQALQDSGCPSCTATSRLPELLTQLGTAALVARSTMLIPVLQLLLLAAYALMLTARLLADHRRMEVALLRSRGAGTPRLAALAAGEALLVALPCAAVAPFLAPPLLSLIGSLPWIAASGVRLAPRADLGTFLVSTGVALASAGLLMLPALAGARRTYVEEQAERGRGGGRGLVERAGADVALLVVAVLAIWQLRRYGAPVTATATGELGVDPLIVSGPALALLTGGMLGLRLVPRVSRLAERLTARRHSLAPALGAWQVSRRPLRYSGPALLLTMAIAIGVMSMATAATWRTSQQDQAAHRAGADLRLSGPPDGPELGALGRGTAFAALPGVTAISPAFRGQAEFGGDDAVLLGLDASRLTELFRLRPDLSDRDPGELSRALRPAGPGSGGLEIPGRPAALAVEVSSDAAAPLRLTVSDALGVWRELPLGTLRPGANRFEADLGGLAGRSGRIAYPLHVRGVTAGPVAEGTGEVTLTGLSADGRPFGAPGADRPLPVTDIRPAVLTPGPAADQGPLPVVLTAGLAESLKLRTGQIGRVTLDRDVVEVEVAGIVEGMPTTAGDQQAVLADWAALQARALAAGQQPRPATEWWLAVRDGATAPARAALDRRPEWDVTAVDRRELTAALRDDPLAGGLQGALILGFVAALVFAVLGFLVNATVAVRERAAEFAVLRALGVSSRQLLGLLAVEQAFVVGLSLVAGTALAAVMGVLVVPHIVLTGQASAVTPDVVLDVPWAATAGLLALVTALLFAIVAGLARTARGHGARLGELQ
ncbi:MULTISPECIES: ABC transporter permease [unclassified Nonomuraea]|uniref:ABC transporter permease n=1 Tax=unclassified Nonomuraea TaxID=2593643 RepID=UPI0033DF139B